MIKFPTLKERYLQNKEFIFFLELSKTKLIEQQIII